MIAKGPIAIVFLFVFVPWSAGAYEIDPGGGYPFDGGIAGTTSDGGCCGLPTELQDDAEILRQDFQKLSLQELLDQQILGTLCSNNACGKLSEEQASRFLDRAIAEAQYDKQWWSEFWAWVVAGFGLVLAVGGLWVSILSLRQSSQNEKEIGQLQGQMENSKGGNP